MRAFFGRLIAVPVDVRAVVAVTPVVPIGNLLRRFWPFARPMRGWLLVGLLILLAIPVLEATQVWLFKLLVDHALVPADLEPLGWIAPAYVLLFLVSAVFSYSDEYLGAWVGERFVLSIRRTLYRHLLRQSPDVLDRRRLGDTLARLSGDVQAIEGFVLGAAGEAISALARIGIFTAVLFYLQWNLALIALIVAPVFWLTARRFSRLIKRASREKRRRAGSLGAVAEEGIANAALIQATNQQEAELARFERENEGILGAELAATRIRALFAPLVELIELAGVLLVLGWGTWALSQGTLTLGGLLAFLAYLGLLYRPVRDLGQLATSVFEASAAAERVLELLDREPLVVERPAARSLGRARGAVEFEDVCFRYSGAERPTLDRVSLRVAPGETIIVEGASGAGKSTLARLLLRVYDPHEGAVRLDAVDLRELTLQSVRANIGVLFQEQLLFDATLRENVLYGKPDASEEEFLLVARATGLDALARMLPDGFETQAGQRGRALSGGQRQRVALARVLLRDTPVLVLDEPFTGLDQAAAEGLLPALEQLCRGRTTIVISHDPLARRLGGRTVTVANSRLLEPAETAA